MIKFNCDFSFKESTFFENFIFDFILKKFKISKIKYQINHEWVNLKYIEEIKEMTYDSLQFYINKETRFLIQKNNPNLLSRICLSELEANDFDVIIFELEKKYSDFVIYGYVCEDIDKGLQNTDELKYWKLFERTIPSYAQIIPNPKYSEGPGSDMIPKEFISIESLPGHSHQMGYDEKLWFGSCWQMYFSSVYYKYIPKFLFDNFTDCYENKVFENGLRKITLYKNIEDYDLPESRAKQWAFRRAVGIDSIAHELTKESNRIEPENLPVKITKQSCVKGTTRVELHHKDRIEIREFLDDGIKVVYEEIKVV